MDYKKSSVNPERRVFGRRQSRPLRNSQAEAIEALLPELCVPDDVMKDAGGLSPETLFPSSDFKAYHLEIGFGGGEHLDELIARSPDVGFLGAEPFINGMATFLRDLDADKRGNVRVLMDDAMLLVRALADNSLEKIYILNADPWHKKRHHKRRIISQKNLDEFSRILKPGGKLITSTDVDDLAEWIVTQASLHPDFKWTAKTADDWRVAPDGWITTRYQTKGAKGAKVMSYLFFDKLE